MSRERKVLTQRQRREAIRRRARLRERRRCLDLIETWPCGPELRAVLVAIAGRVRA